MRILLDVCPTYQRLLALATGFCLLTGCGDKALDKPLPKARGSVRVTLPWKNGAAIPREYTCDGAEKRPLVRASTDGHPQALVMTDPDAPGGTFVHWTRWGAVEGRNSFGRMGYSGPCPPKGDSPHRYIVTVYALRKPLALGPGAEPDKVVAAIRKVALASGSAAGTFGR